MIYTVGGIKGGTGKTTVATHLTIMLAHAVLLVDADEQLPQLSLDREKGVLECLGRRLAITEWVPKTPKAIAKVMQPFVCKFR